MRTQFPKYQFTHVSQHLLLQQSVACHVEGPWDHRDLSCSIGAVAAAHPPVQAATGANVSSGQPACPALCSKCSKVERGRAAGLGSTGSRKLLVGAVIIPQWGQCCTENASLCELAQRVHLKCTRLPLRQESLVGECM